MPDRTPLSDADIEAALADLAGWHYDAEAHQIVCDYQFGTFRDAVAWIVRAAFEADDMDHHPELTNVYDRVTVALATHDAGDRVTATDLALAQRLSALGA